MDTSSISTGAVRVDISAMGTWQSQIAEIATANKTIATELTTLVNSLDSFWQGNSATSFVEKYTNCLNELTIASDRLIELSKALQIVVQTVENE